MLKTDEYNPVTTVGELKKAIADLPDDMPVGKWDGCEAYMAPRVNAAPSTVYKTYDGLDTIYDWRDGDEPTPSKQMLVI